MSHARSVPFHPRDPTLLDSLLKPHLETPISAVQSWSTVFNTIGCACPLHVPYSLSIKLHAAPHVTNNHISTCSKLAPISLHSLSQRLLLRVLLSLVIGSACVRWQSHAIFSHVGKFMHQKNKSPRCCPSLIMTLYIIVMLTQSFFINPRFLNWFNFIWKIQQLIGIFTIISLVQSLIDQASQGGTIIFCSKNGKVSELWG